MMPIIENYAIIKGKVEKITLLETPTGFTQLDILFEKSTSVENFPNLALLDIGKAMPVNCHSQFAKTIKVGDMIELKVKKVTNVLYYAMEP